MNPPNITQIVKENAERVKGYVFGESKGPLPTEPCARCEGRGYKKQAPGEYGLCECTSCGGSGKQLKIRRPAPAQGERNTREPE